MVIGKDLAGYFPRVLSTKGHIVLSRSNITGNLIVSGRMKSMQGEDNSTFNNRTIVRQVDPYLKMLSTDCVLVPPVKRSASCRGCTECKKTYLPDPARQEEQMALLKQNLAYCTKLQKFKAQYVYNNQLKDLPVYDTACKRVALSLEKKLCKENLYDAFIDCVEDFIERGVLKYPEDAMNKLQQSFIPLCIHLERVVLHHYLYVEINLFGLVITLL